MCQAYHRFGQVMFFVYYMQVLNDFDIWSA